LPKTTETTMGTSGRAASLKKKPNKKIEERQINTNTNTKARRDGWRDKLNTAFVLAASVSC